MFGDSELVEVQRSISSQESAGGKGWESRKFGEFTGTNRRKQLDEENEFETNRRYSKFQQRKQFDQENEFESGFSTVEFQRMSVNQVEKSLMLVKLPTLDTTNFPVWKFKIELTFERLQMDCFLHSGVQNIVSTTSFTTRFGDFGVKRAKSWGSTMCNLLINAMPDDLLPLFMHDLNCRREPSKIIEILCHNLSVDFTEQRSRLFKEFHTLKLETCNNVREYGIKLESIFKELRSLGAEISPEQLKFQLFHGLPGVYGPIVAVLMESTRSYNEMVAKLVSYPVLASDSAIRSSTTSGVQQDNMSALVATSSGKACYGCGKTGHVRAQCRSAQTSGQAGDRRKCYKCHEVGHIASGCPNKKHVKCHFCEGPHHIRMCDEFKAVKAKRTAAVPTAVLAEAQQIVQPTYFPSAFITEVMQEDRNTSKEDHTPTSDMWITATTMIGMWTCWATAWHLHPPTAAYIPIVAFILSLPKMTSWIKGLVETVGAWACLSATDTQTEWVMDTGATEHMTDDLTLLYNVKVLKEPMYIATGNGRVRCEKAGQATLHVRRGISVQDITLKHVLYVPTLGRNLLSINRLVTAVGGTYVYKDSDSEVIDASGASVLCGKRTAHCSLHTVVLGSPATDLLRAAYPADAAVTNRLALWHRRLGHLNCKTVCELAGGNGVKVSEKDKKTLPMCSQCVVGKMTRLRIPKMKTRAVEHMLDVVSADIGVVNIQSHQGCRYFLLLVDHHTRYGWVYFLTRKSDILECLRNFTTMCITQFGRGPKIVRTDNEFRTKAIDKFCQKMGIAQEFSCPHTPFQNGVAERAIRTLVEMTRTMLLESGLPSFWWAEFASTALYILNRTPHAALQEGLSPFMKVYGSVPDLSYFRVPGCVAWAKSFDPQRKKLDAKAKKLVFIGYSSSYKGWKLADPITKRITFSRDVVFDENTMSANVQDPIYFQEQRLILLCMK